MNAEEVTDPEDDGRDLRIRLASPVMGDEEVEAVRAVLLSGQLTNGPAVVAFEAAFAERHQVGHAVALANGTVGLAAIYLALGIGPGDEVITPSFTFISTATSIRHVGGRPIFADVDATTFNLDPVDVARRLTPRTRAIVAVHYGGQPADMDDLRAVADDAGVALLEDAAQAHGATYRGRPVGGLGRAAMFSFTPTKNITTGEGAVVTTDDGDLARRVRLLRNHGQTSRYRHDHLGYNWRLSDVQAAIGRCQLDRLDGILARKEANDTTFRRLLDGIAGVSPPVRRPDRSHPFMLYSLLLDRDRDAVLQALLAEGIEARLYFPPAHRQPVFADVTTLLPVTDDLAARLVSVPFHSRITVDDMADIADALTSAVRGGDSRQGSAQGGPVALE